jgi:tRNA(Ile)-lysidine synthase
VPGLVTVDHGLQVGSAGRAAEVAEWARSVRFDPVEVATVEVAGLGGGPEAAARTARYAALSGVAERVGAGAVLLGHTRDDQAETVLLALARGAGPRGLSGMPYQKGVFIRPLLTVSREETRKACAVLGLPIWEDPHNTDFSYARARVRAEALPALVAALGAGVVDNLARTATQLAVDNAALDELAGLALQAARSDEAAGEDGSAEAARSDEAVGEGGSAEAARSDEGGLSVAVLAGLLDAVRRRVLHAWARELGAPGSALSHHHVAALDALITDWHGQGPTMLPGAIVVTRRGDRLIRMPSA